MQRQEGKFSEHRARFYFGEIVLALDYLHSFGIVFRYAVVWRGYICTCTLYIVLPGVRGNTVMQETACGRSYHFPSYREWRSYFEVKVHVPPIIQNTSHIPYFLDYMPGCLFTYRVYGPRVNTRVVLI